MQRCNLIGRFAIIAATMLISLQTSNAADTARLIITGRASTLQWPVFIAMAKGLFSARGLTIDLATAQSTVATI